MIAVCLEKTTNALIGAQYGGDIETHLKAVKENALEAGYKEDEIIVKSVTAEEYQAIKAAQPKPEPTQEQLIQAEMQRLLREQAIANLQAEGKL